MAGKSAKVFAAQAGRFGGALGAALKQGVFESAMVVKSSVQAELGSGHLSGVGKSGARVSAGFEIRGAGANPAALIRMRGPAHLLERPTRPHEIPTPGKTGRGGRRRVAVIPGVGPRVGIRHPGTRGKFPFAKGVARAAPVTPTIFARNVRVALAKTFFG